MTTLTTPMQQIPAWAVLQRRLFDVMEDAWRQFSERYCEADGRLRYTGGFEDRDGVDDFYEPFFNWPALYALGGSDDLLRAAKHHWEGVTAQLSEAGMLTNEYENGYDWFHQGESLVFFYGICAADPADEAFRDRARRFARLYTDPASGNYDARCNIIRAPHTGALGARPGLGPAGRPYSPSEEMRPYGLPFHDVDGIGSWDDLNDPDKALAMGRAMQDRAKGDVAVNLAASSLVANHWLYDGDTESSQWLARYVRGWAERAEANNGILPDNVGPTGRVGELHDGRWFGGHYGWTFPHGMHSVVPSSLIAGINASLVAQRDDLLAVTGTMLDVILGQGIEAVPSETPFSLSQFWFARYGEGVDQSALLVPYRHGPQGWFDYGPMQLELPLWLWWWTRTQEDWDRVQRVLDHTPARGLEVLPFRDKGEGGHDAPWLDFLQGRRPDYPVEALSMALGQVARRVAVMEAERERSATAHLHFWQRANPIVTEVLSQLITGTPQVLYNGGLPFAAVTYEDVDRDRPGLPPDVAALVTSLQPDRIELQLVNLSTTRRRRVRVRPSRFGEYRLTGHLSHGERDGDYPGPSEAAGSTPGRPHSRQHARAESALVDLAPSHSIDLTLLVERSADPARHHPAASSSERAGQSYPTP